MDYSLRTLELFDHQDNASRFEEAAAEAVRLHPDAWQLRLRLAEHLAPRQRLDESESVMLDMIKNQIKRQQLDEAVKSLDRLLELKPDSTTARALQVEWQAEDADIRQGPW